MKPNPIPTVYGKTLFRSRLEARWAIFFDSLGLRWLYEPEGYDLAGTWYLPDFYLPQHDLIIEIKPGNPKEFLDHPVWEYIKNTLKDDTSEHPLLEGFLLLKGHPSYSNQDSFFPNFDYEGYIFNDDGYLWCECPKCGLIGIEYEARAARLKCGHGRPSDRGHNPLSDRLRDAYDKASSYFFIR